MSSWGGHGQLYHDGCPPPCLDLDDTPIRRGRPALTRGGENFQHIE